MNVERIQCQLNGDGAHATARADIVATSRKGNIFLLRVDLHNKAYALSPIRMYYSTFYSKREEVFSSFTIIFL